MWLQRVLLTTVAVVMLTGVASGQSALSISGRIVDCTNSRPIANASIQIDAIPHSIITDSDGGFCIYGLQAGEYHARIEAPAYFPKENQLMLVNGDFSADVTICLAPRLYWAESQRVITTAEHDQFRSIVIDHDSPEFKSSSDLGDLLETIPEVVISYAGGKNGEAKLSVKGGPSKEVLVLVDGISINSPITGVADINSVPLANVSRIEFNSGALSSQYGAGAVGGVLSIVTATAGGLSECGLSGSSGKYKSRSWESSAKLSLRSIGDFSGLYSGSSAANHFMFEHPKNGQTSRENADYRRTNGSMSGKRDVGDLRFTAAYHRFEQVNGVPRFIYVEEHVPYARKEESRDLLTLRFDDGSPDHRYSLRYSYKHNAQLFQDTLSFYAYHAKYFDDLHQIAADGNWLLPLDVRFSASTTTEWENFSQDNYLYPQSGMKNVAERRAGLAMHAIRNWQFESAIGSIGADIQMRMRGDYSSLAQPFYSPSVQLGSSFREWVTIRGDMMYGRSYRAPLYSSLFWDDGSLAVGNPDLRPERIEESSASLNLSMPIVGRLEFGLQYQHSAFEDLIYWIQTVDHKFSPRNLSGSLIFTRTMNASWHIRPLNLTLDYSNIDQISKNRAEVHTQRNMQLTYRPRYMQYFSASYAGRCVDLRYRLRHVSKRYTRDANTKWLDGYTVADLSAALKYDFRIFSIRLQYDADNITNERYMLVDRFPIPGRVWSVSAKLAVPLGLD